jgi:acetyl esterase/lipase
MVSQQAKDIVALLRSRPVAETGATLPEMRAGYEQFVSMVPMAADITCEKVNAGGVSAEWVCAPGASTGRAVLYVHGGGYVIGSLNTHRELCGGISRASGARVLALDYRLAPEHPFPAALEDAVAGYQWLLAQGIAPGAIAISGDSAGGGLTLATLVALRDRGLPLPGCAAVLSPWTDLAISGQSVTSRAAIDPMVQREAITFMADAYLGGQDARTPLASPLYAGLKGLPPLLIQVGTSETLFDDAVRFDAAARSAGVDVTFEAWNEMVHVFQSFGALLPEALEATERIGAFVKAHTAS